MRTPLALRGPNRRLRLSILPVVWLAFGLAMGCPARGGPAVQQAHPPSRGNNPQQPTKGAGQLEVGQPQMVDYPPMAVDYINATLREPATDQHAPLGQAWDSVEHLADGSAFTAEITMQVNRGGAAPAAQLIAPC